jgi:hypothetical protein
VLCWARPLLVLSSSPASSGAGLWSLLRGLQPVGGLLGLLLVLLARAPEDDAAGYLPDGDGDVQLAAVERRFMVPPDAFPQIEDIGRVIRRLPPFGQIGLDNKGAWLHPRTDLMPYQPAVDEAQRGIRLEVGCEMMVKVDGVVAAYTEDTAALGWARFRQPRAPGDEATARPTA